MSLFNHIHQDAIGRVAQQYNDLAKGNLEQMANAQAYLNHMDAKVLEVLANNQVSLSDLCKNLFHEVTQNIGMQEQQQALPGKIALVRTQKGNQLTQLINAENARLAQIENERQNAVSNANNALNLASQALMNKMSGNYHKPQLNDLKQRLSDLQNRLSTADRNKNSADQINQITNHINTLKTGVENLKQILVAQPRPRSESPSGFVKARRTVLFQGGKKGCEIF